MGIAIRQMTDPTESERHALAELLITTVADGASVGFLPPLAYPDARAYWDALPDAHTILLVAEQDGRIVGTVQGRLAPKANGSHRAEIARLLVHPDARRQGLGRQLIAAVEAELAAHGRWLIVLDTRDGDPSNQLYRSMGYIESGRIPDYARSASGSFDATVLYHKRLDRPVPLG